MGPFFRKGKPYASDGAGMFPLQVNMARTGAPTVFPLVREVAPDGSWAVRATEARLRCSAP